MTDKQNALELCTEAVKTVSIIILSLAKTLDVTLEGDKVEVSEFLLNTISSVLLHTIAMISDNVEIGKGEQIIQQLNEAIRKHLSEYERDKKSGGKCLN
jgi:hypothetical protein